ncbi:MAG: hypothetical protein ACOYB3_01970 [Azonexus sp.]
MRTDSVLPLRYACHRCGKTYGTYQGRNLHHTLAHKEVAMREVAEGNRVREANRAALAPLNLLNADRLTLEAIRSALDDALANNDLLHVHERPVRDLYNALTYRLGGK